MEKVSLDSDLSTLSPLLAPPELMKGTYMVAGLQILHLERKIASLLKQLG